MWLPTTQQDNRFFLPFLSPNPGCHLGCDRWRKIWREVYPGFFRLEKIGLLTLVGRPVSNFGRPHSMASKTLRDQEGKVEFFPGDAFCFSSSICLLPLPDLNFPSFLPPLILSYILPSFLKNINYFSNLEV